MLLVVLFIMLLIEFIMYIVEKVSFPNLSDSYHDGGSTASLEKFFANTDVTPRANANASVL